MIQKKTKVESTFTNIAFIFSLSVINVKQKLNFPNVVIFNHSLFTTRIYQTKNRRRFTVFFNKKNSFIRRCNKRLGLRKNINLGKLFNQRMKLINFFIQKIFNMCVLFRSRNLFVSSNFLNTN